MEIVPEAVKVTVLEIAKEIVPVTVVEDVMEVALQIAVAHVKVDVGKIVHQIAVVHAEIVVNIVVEELVMVDKKEMKQTLTFIVTQDCQLSCRYCYLVGKNNKMTMSNELALKIVDFLLEENTILNKEKPIVFDFIGGEPLLCIDLIKNTCDYITERLLSSDYYWKDNHSFRITTNGILYGTEAVQDFIKEYSDRLYVSISIDGNKAKHDASRVYKNGMGSWNKVIRNIPLWLEQFPNVSTKIVISSENIKYLKDSVVYLINTGIKHIDVNPVLEGGWKDGDEELFENQLVSLADYIIDNELSENVHISCFSEHIGTKLSVSDELKWCDLSETICVDANGAFFPCIRFAQYSLRNKEAWLIGNIYDGMDKNKIRPFLMLDRITQSPKECLECDVSGGCGWCPAENYDCAYTHTLYQRSTAVCKIHKARVRAKNYFWNKLSR